MPACCAELPLELLLHIFKLYLGETHLNDLIRRNNPSSPVILASVCRSWSAICISTPNFWSSFFFEGGYDEPDTPRILAILRLYLERSRSEHLKVKATIYQKDDLCLRELIRHSERWVHLHLAFVGPPMNRDQFHGIKNRLPILSRLVISSTARLTYPPNYTIDAFKNAPLLRHFTVYGHTPEFDLPYDQITDLTAYISDFDTPALQLAAKCTNVHTLRVTPNIEWTTHIKSDNIRHLTVALAGHTYMTGISILTKFTTPRLSVLRITCSRPTAPFGWPQQDFIAFIHRSHPLALKELAIDDVLCNMTGEQLVECLTLLPALQTLKFQEGLQGRAFTDVVYESLARRVGSGSDLVNSLLQLCPRLTTLVIQGSCIPDPTILTEMIEARATTLKHLTLPKSAWSDDFPPLLDARIRDSIEDEALDIYTW